MIKSPHIVKTALFEATSQKSYRPEEQWQLHITAEGHRPTLRHAAAFAPRVLANSVERCALLGKEIYEPLLGAEQFNELPLGRALIVNQ